MFSQNQKVMIVDLTLQEYDSLVKQMDKESTILFFNNIRKVGKEHKKELVGIKMRKSTDDGEIKKALQGYQIEEYFMLENAERGYKVFYGRTDGSVIYRLAFLIESQQKSQSSLVVEMNAVKWR